MYFRNDRGDYPEIQEEIDGTKFTYKRDPRWGLYFVQFSSGKTPAALEGRFSDIGLLKEKVQNYFASRPKPDRQHNEFRNGIAKEKRLAAQSSQHSN